MTTGSSGATAALINTTPNDTLSDEARPAARYSSSCSGRESEAEREGITTSSTTTE
eukprot:CAMPEP_0182830904 /NCGR_PEP_ID=MMETSP0006_2-20121128/18828_1 /TAXON_ID=97485 /ORGANISM="Prymnesium parvum, Strain Texoma1" /LENGTH=55 /DNA_ID=CAMNT_0024958511 /DNA_START=414 /DNA_END=581 /DNA_ORIENTATION=-